MADVWSWTPQPRIIPQSSALADQHRQTRFEWRECSKCKGWHSQWWRSIEPPSHGR